MVISLSRQQIRGSGSPSGSVTSRQPNPVSRMTAPMRSPRHVPIDRRIAARADAPQRREHGVGRLRPNAEDRLAFVRNMQRIDAEQLAGRAHRRR